jgi:hypothetical protein
MTVLQCNFCNEIYYDEIEYDNHLQLDHNKVRVFDCKICDEKCRGTNEMDKHLQFAHGTTHWDVNLAQRSSQRILKEASSR